MWISELNPHKTFHLSFVQLTHSNSFPKKFLAILLLRLAEGNYILFLHAWLTLNKIGPDPGFGLVVQENYDCENGF